ncbi:recombination-associated protein RdgC [Limnobacter sp.]|uniref:recombination-associated protein RdgC n=1 Tax=Limnobacter sp. TaxID=2003368 RepID=UPI002589BB0A|nr:recombination-associated protein RdgC [Limnobacter sp.]
MWFKNLLIYSLKSWTDTAESLEEKLAEHALQACGGLEMQTQGWVAPKGEGNPFVHAQGQHLLITLGMEKKLLPTTVVNQFAKARAAEIEERDGYKPGRKQLKEIKEDVLDDLLPRAFVIRSTVRAWIDTRRQFLIVDAGAASKADALVSLLIKCVEGTGLSPLKTKLSPTVAMTSWMADDDNPPQFSIDQDCELRGRGEAGSTVRYVRHSLEVDEIRKHIEGGKDVTKLAMTWADRVSFVLQENLQIKRVSPLDVIREQASLSAPDEEFEADFALMTGELGKLLDALVDALGGPLNASPQQ